MESIGGGQDGIRVIECKMLGPGAIKVSLGETVKLLYRFKWFLKLVDLVFVGRHRYRRHLLRLLLRFCYNYIR